MKSSTQISDANDEDLLRRATRGSEEAFVVLYRRHESAIFRFALHMSGRRETAEEVTQEVFLGLLSGSLRYSAARGSLQGYLIGAARNQVRRHLRNAHAPSGAAAVTITAQTSNQPELIALRQALLQLCPNYREVVVLCDLEGLSYEEAAEQFGCAVGTIRSRLHRARALLLGKLQGRREKCLR